LLPQKALGSNICGRTNHILDELEETIFRKNVYPLLISDPNQNEDAVDVIQTISFKFAKKINGIN
jgi:hypothetical protein